MQLKLNQYEIQQALTEFIQKRSSSKVKLTAFDLKGMRSEEGYHANVEIEYEDVSYEEVVPKLGSAHKEETVTKTTSVKESEPEMTEEARTVILEVLNLMNTNVQHCNTAKLIRLVEKGSEEVQKYFENNPTYKATVEDFKSKTEIEPVKEEEEMVSEEEEEEEITSIEPVEEEKEEGEEKESTLDILNPSISQGETAIKLNIFGKPIGSDTVATKPIFG